jgi:hypothetical protein
MKQGNRSILILAIASIAVCCTDIARAENEAFDPETCTYNGKPLFGKVEVVESSGDIKIKPVESFPDLKVKIVDGFADDCGEWEFVESSGDFTIQFVDSFPDLEIEMVDSFPGIP